MLIWQLQKLGRHCTVNQLQEWVGLILLRVIRPLWALVWVVSWNTELQWGDTGETLIIQLAYEVDCSIVTAMGRVQVHQEFRIEPCDLPL